jgi:hypothetical protein
MLPRIRSFTVWLASRCDDGASRSGKSRYCAALCRVEKRLRESASTQRSLHCAPPDFLSRLAALIICMRLSLRKGAGSAGNPRNYTGNRGCGAPGTCGRDGANSVHSTLNFTSREKRARYGSPMFVARRGLHSSRLTTESVVARHQNVTVTT